MQYPDCEGIEMADERKLKYRDHDALLKEIREDLQAVVDRLAPRMHVSKADADKLDTAASNLSRLAERLRYGAESGDIP